jgi:hypothetical protein
LIHIVSNIKGMFNALYQRRKRATTMIEQNPSPTPIDNR